MQQTEIHAIVRSMQIRHQAFINGEYVDAHSKQTFSVINPANQEHLAEVTRCDQDDVNHAVRAARAAFNS